MIGTTPAKSAKNQYSNSMSLPICGSSNLQESLANAKVNARQHCGILDDHFLSFAD